MEVTTSTNYTAQYIGLGVLIILIGIVVFILRSKASRIIKYDINTLVTVFFLLAILVLINAIPASMHELAIGSVKIPLEGRKDFTQNQRNTLTEQTIGILRGLKQDVSVVAFYRRGTPDESAARDMLDQYQYYSNHFKYKFVDPYADPVTALTYKDELRLIDPQHVTILPGTVVLEVQDPTANPPVRRQSAQLPTNGKAGEAEVKLSQALFQVLNPEKRTLYFTTGHGEKSPDAAPNSPSSLQAMKDELEKSQYQFKSFSLYKDNKVPADADAVLVVGPTKDFEKSETDILGKYLDGGGRVLMMLDPPNSYPNLSAFLEAHGVQLGNNLIIDPEQGFSHQPAYPMIGNFSTTSPITQGYDIQCFFNVSRSLAPTQKTPPNVKTDVIAKTMDESWALPDVDKGLPQGKIQFDPQKDAKGPLGVAMSVVVTPSASPSPPPAASPSASPAPTPKEGRMVVFGDSGFAGGMPNLFLVAGNSDLFLRSVNWLAQGKDFDVGKRPPLDTKPLNLPDSAKYRIMWISMVLIPGTVAMLGIVVFMLYKPN